MGIDKTLYWSLDKDYRDKLHTYAYLDGWLTNQECDILLNYVIKYTENFQNGQISGPKNGVSPHGDNEVRRSNVLFLNNQDHEIRWLFNKLSDCVTKINNRFFNYDLYGIETIQFTNYDCNDKGFYCKHTDTLKHLLERKLSCTVQLSDENSYEGGDVILHSCQKPEYLPKRRGTIIFFPSYIVHEVTPVTYGIRNSLVSWIQGPPFR